MSAPECRLPVPRGALSELLLSVLTGDPARRTSALRGVAPADGDAIHDEDLQLTLWLLYELAYHGFADVDPDWEWHPDLIALRRTLEAPFEAQLRCATRHAVTETLATDDLPEALFALVAADDSPSVARYLLREATREEALEFLVHRSIYHLKESDPHSFQLARLSGRPKVALAELQYDEYGGGRPDRLHSRLFEETLDACGLDSTYGAYLDVVPAVTLAVNNAMSLFGLHRRLRGAAMGHLGAFEATSSLPCRRYAGGLRRLGFPDCAAAYFDEHVEADAVHEQLAFREICGGLAAQHPELREDIAFGAATCLHLDALAGSRLLTSWADGRSSLLGDTGTAEVVA